MRRKEKEIKESRILRNVLEEAQTCRIAMCDGDTPYVLPMNFGYRDDCIYLHSAQEGRKIEVLKRNPKVCFEIEAYSALKESGEDICKTGMHYFSVVGTGTAEFVCDEIAKKEALDIILTKITGTAVHRYSAQSLAQVTIIKIPISEMIGKKSE